MKKRTKGRSGHKPVVVDEKKNREKGDVAEHVYLRLESREIRIIEDL